MKGNSTAAQDGDSGTDVTAFMQDLDGGVFERKLSLALSQVAAASIDNDRVGDVTLKFSFKRIPGTTQVHCAHQLSFTRPTLNGTAGEKEERVTPMFVGKYGRLSLAPENQMSFLDKQTGEVK